MLENVIKIFELQKKEIQLFITELMIDGGVVLYCIQRCLQCAFPHVCEEEDE